MFVKSSAVSALLEYFTRANRVAPSVSSFFATSFTTLFCFSISTSAEQSNTNTVSVYFLTCRSDCRSIVISAVLSPCLGMLTRCVTFIPLAAFPADAVVTADASAARAETAPGTPGMQSCTARTAAASRIQTIRLDTSFCNIFFPFSICLTSLYVCKSVFEK